MAMEMVMPKLGLSMVEATIVEWFRKEGDFVAKNDEILEIETEKLTYAVPAPSDGTILKIVAEAGTVLPVGEPIAYIGEPGEQLPVMVKAELSQVGRETASIPTVPVVESAMPDASAGTGRIKIAPAARVLAQKLNIDWSSVVGTGPGGRIIKEDIEAYSQNTITAPTVEPPTQTSQPADGSFDTLSYVGMRKVIGTKMLTSWNTAPMVTNHVRANVEDLLILRQNLNAGLRDGQSKLTITDLLVKIVAKALVKMPLLNATLDGETIKILKNINVGVAMALDNGLIVPVIHDADKKDVFAVSSEIRTLGEKAKSNSLIDEDVTGGTFTITNLGSYGSVDFFTPIVNQPESAILGVGAAKKEAVVIDDVVTVRSTMGLSLTYDHRVVDGAPAAKFMAGILELLQNPARAIFEP